MVIKQLVSRLDVSTSQTWISEFEFDEPIQGVVEELRTASNKVDMLPGEDEDDYNGFFDNVEEPFSSEKTEEKLKDDGYDRISVPDDELKEIMEQVDQEIIAEENIEKSKLENEKTSNGEKRQNKVEFQPIKKPNVLKHFPKVIPRNQAIKKENNNNNDTDVNCDSWNYDKESIEGFDLEKFKKANVNSKNIASKEARNFEYKVYNVDPFTINTNSIHSGFDSDVNSRFGDKNKGPKFDFVDERLMSQIESEYS
ncbi:hypothetical protein GQR58_019864 [Nymphon striatum]|nr:hypothetical protein GQR58_019864 [Nymphon striatum]